MTHSFHLKVDFYANRYVGTNLSNPSFADISRTMGAEGIRVTKPEEVGPALTSLINSGKPGVLEIVVSQVNKIKCHGNKHFCRLFKFLILVNYYTHHLFNFF